MGIAGKKMKFFSRNSFKQIAIILLCLFIFFKLGNIIFSKKDVYFNRDYSAKYESLKSVYYSSQYVKKVNPGIIPDNGLEAFAGGIFLKGLNPILIVHDQPPLGRYITSLSILIFDNANTINLFLQFLSLLGIYFIANLVFNNSLFSFIVLSIFIQEPLFIDKFSYTPLLETIQFPFIVFALYFFIKAIQAKKYKHWFILTSLMLGFVISIRFFSLGAVELASMLFYFLLRKEFNKKLIFFMITLPLSLAVLIFSYTRTIMDGYTMLQIFGIQKYILTYHKSKLILPFTVWDLLLFNKWHTWWGDRSISSDSQWTVLWPISTILSYIQMGVVLFRKTFVNDAEIIISLWVVSYTAFLSVGFSSVRYFLPLIPFIYILAFSFMLKIAKITLFKNNKS